MYYPTGKEEFKFLPRKKHNPHANIVTTIIKDYTKKGMIERMICLTLIFSPTHSTYVWEVYQGGDYLGNDDYTNPKRSYTYAFENLPSKYKKIGDLLIKQHTQANWDSLNN